LHKTKLTCFF